MTQIPIVLLFQAATERGALPPDPYCAGLAGDGTSLAGDRADQHNRLRLDLALRAMRSPSF